MITDRTLIYTLICRQDLTASDINRMLQLMQAHYTHVTETMFLKDLSEKQYIGMIRDAENTCQGFTTYVIDPKACAGDDYHIIFSGDTIIHEDHWGSQIMMKGWCTSVGTMVATDTSKPWYWYLMSKGHRTYMYLPLFFRSYYPSLEQVDDQEPLALIADQVSRILFGKDWKKDRGIISFQDHHGAMNADLTDATYKKANNHHVRFFIEKNPGFHKGDELVCIARLSQDNLMRSAKELFIEGFRYSLPC
jgi:hypothetical protein